MPRFTPAPPGPERIFNEHEPMPPELLEDEPDVEDQPCETVPPVVVWDTDRDWYLDHTEQQWLTTKEIGARFPSYRSSTFTENVVERDAFGLRTARRRVWHQQQNSRTRRIRVYEYPLWRVNAWAHRLQEASRREGVIRDKSESQWLTADDVAQRFGLDRTTFQHAVSRNHHGLQKTRRTVLRAIKTTRREQIYQYPLWRVELWAGTTPSRALPTPQEVKQLRGDLDVAASLLAREVGFSPSEVRAAAAIGDLDAQVDPNTSKVLFLAPRSTGQWLRRDSWRRTD